MKTYVVGTGGVGGYFGGKLAKAGIDVTFVARGDFYESVKNDGLRVNALDGDFVVRPAKVIDLLEKIVDPDLIIFTVKTYDTESVASQLKHLVKPNTYIITFQNGIENDLIIEKIINNATVIPGIAYVISSKGGDGVIHQTGGAKKLIIGRRDNSGDDTLNEIHGLLTKSGIDSIISDDIERDLWKKYIFINAFSGFTALCRASIGDIRNDKFTFDLYKRSVMETISVSKALKINLPETIYDDVIKISENTTPESKSSLLLDIENNRKTEIETLHGTLVRFAGDLKIPVPINRTIYSALKFSSTQNG